MLVMALGLDLGLVVAEGVPRKHLLLHLGVILILATSVVLTNSRGGIFAMMVQVVLLALLFMIRRSLETPSKDRVTRRGCESVGWL